MSDFEETQRLIRLKRYEQPPEGYFENFLDEFHERQRADLVRKSSRSLFVERFYCRYLCALGAALAIPGRIRMFEWLKRYRECGSPCQRCANDCMVAAIHPEGHINPNECLYCLNCQTLYFDEHRCPVMIQRRLMRERRSVGK